MYSKSVFIGNPSGLHARPASDFIKCAKTYSCRITIAEEGREKEAVNAKSIVCLLTLGLTQGKRAVITAKGDAEEEAVEALAALVEGGFGE